MYCLPNRCQTIMAIARLSTNEFGSDGLHAPRHTIKKPGKEVQGPDARWAQVVDLNSIHINPQQPWQVVVGGSDAFARVYDNRRTAGATHWSQAGRQPGNTGWGRAALGQPVSMYCCSSVLSPH